MATEPTASIDPSSPSGKSRDKPVSELPISTVRSPTDRPVGPIGMVSTVYAAAQPVHSTGAARSTDNRWERERSG